MASYDRDLSNHSHLVIILLSAILGAMVAGIVLYYPQSQSPAEAQETGVNVKPPAAATELENTFVGVAERTLPVVVSIRTEVKRSAEGQKDMRDFFKEFPFPFGPFERGPEGEGPQQKRQKPEGIPRARGMGAGWVFDEDGYIVTNSHVIRDADKITVRLHDKKNDEKNYTAKLIGNDPKTELAVVKVDVDRKLPTLQMGSSGPLKVGQWVMAVGAPFKLEQTATAGIVSAKGRFLPGKNPRYIRIGDVIQTDAAINPGNSGGPLVNLHGEVVGVNVAIVSNSMTPGNVGIGFAVPSDTARRVVPALIEQGKVTRGWLGITISELEPADRDFFGVKEGGVLVEAIKEGGPASRSELKEKDVIVAVDGEKVTTTWDLQKTIMSKDPGNTVTLKVIRDKKPTELTVKLGEMPAKYQGLAGEEAAKPEAADETSALGLTVKPLTPDVKKMLGTERNEGVVVTKVQPGGPAFGEIAKGSIITQINRQKIEGMEDFTQAMERAEKTKPDHVMVFFEVKVPGEEEWVKQHKSIDVDW